MPEGSLRCRTVMNEAKGTCSSLPTQERTRGSQQSTIWTVALTRAYVCDPLILDSTTSRAMSTDFCITTQLRYFVRVVKID